MDYYNEYTNSFNDELNSISNTLIDEYKLIPLSLDVINKIILDVWYLRYRSRWCKQLEDLLVENGKNGIYHNMGEFGVTYVI